MSKWSDAACDRLLRDVFRPVAALFVQKNGTYYDMPGVDPWDVERDAMRYDGPHPVVAHPPCSRWCRLAGLVEARWGHKKGDDGGMFAFALDAVRRWGGVLEHPAYSDAFAAHGLATPTYGGWQRCLDGGWVAQVDQAHYGHRARKATWLYAHGIASLPSLPGECLISWCGNNVSSGETRERLGKREASKSPSEFAQMLVDLARSATRSDGA